MIQDVSLQGEAAPRLGQLGESRHHGPDQKAGLIHYAIGDSSPTLRVGLQPAVHRRRWAEGQIVSSAPGRSSGCPASWSRRCADVTMVTWMLVPVRRSRQFRCEIDS